MSEMEDFVPVVEPVRKRKPSAKRKSKVVAKKSSKKRKVAKEERQYNIDKDEETGVMKLQERHFYRLIIGEQKIKLQERDLQIAKSALKDFQIQVNAQIQTLQAKIKECSNLLRGAQAEYWVEVRSVEEATGLALKDWTIDDDRTLRPIEKEESS